MKDATTRFNSIHVMDNHSKDKQKLQRYTELKKVFDLLKQEWPKCFDNIGMYIPEAQLAVCCRAKN